MQEQCRELSKWQQNNPDTHKTSYVKKPHVPDRPTRSKQISTLVSKQVAAKMQNYNISAHVNSAHVACKAAADDEQHLMSVVQSAVASISQLHLASLSRLDNNRPTAIHYHLTGKPPSNSLITKGTSQLDGVWWFPPSIRLRGDWS